MTPRARQHGHRPNATRLAAVATVAALAALLPAGAAQANPWTRDAGHFYANLSLSRIRAHRLYAPDFVARDLLDVDGDGKPEAYTQHVLALYGEIGIISRWLTATVDITLMRHASLDKQGSTLGLGDMRIGLWSGVLTWPIRLSVGVLFGLPTGDPVPQAGDGASRQDKQTANSLPTGDGEFDVELAVALGYSFGGKRWPLSHYVAAQAGFWIRSTPREVAFGEPQNLPNALNWRIEFGTRAPNVPVLRRLWLIVRLLGTEAFADKDELAMNASGLGAAIHTSWNVEVFAQLWRGIGASFGVSGAPRAASLPAGLNFRWSLSFEM